MPQDLVFDLHCLVWFLSLLLVLRLLLFVFASSFRIDQSYTQA